MGDVLHLDDYRQDDLRVTVGTHSSGVVLMFQSTEDVDAEEAFVVGISAERAIQVAHRLTEAAASVLSTQCQSPSGTPENPP